MFLPLLVSTPCFGWGSEGHRLINRVAAEKLPADVPAFLRTPAAVEEIEWLGPEPDRWRNPAAAALVNAQAPEHFIDIEYADRVGPLPRKRFDFIAALYATAAKHPEWAAELAPEKVGLLPWMTTEVWERLTIALGNYRQSSAAHEDTKPVEAAILFYAGWLGHYVGDGSQPLHVTIKYNGWVGDNPNGYTTAHQIHWQFEGPFVGANVHEADVAPLVPADPKPVGDVFEEDLSYLRNSNTYVEKVYQFEKAGGWVGAGTPESRKFAAERVAAGATELRDLIVAAWVASGKLPPDPYAPKK